MNVPALLRQTSAVGLLSAAELDAFLAQSGLDPGQEAVVLSALVDVGKLTSFQVQALQQGQSARLVLGNYILLERLGKGGMGEVFKARHRRMDRVVALKLMNDSFFRFPEGEERFQREMKIAARLTHPNIVAAYDADAADGVHFLVLEYVDGADLEGVLRHHGPLPGPAAAQVILQAARGLDYAHRKGIIHRDLKPSNLMLDRAGVVRIMDMGLAHLEESPGNGPLTQTQDVFGSIDHMAPEQAESAKYADQRSDIYSLGCTLFTLATGHVPYPGESAFQKFLAHRDNPIPSICELHPGFPTWLEALFFRMVAKLPEARFQTAADLIAALEPQTVAFDLATLVPPPVARPPLPLPPVIANASSLGNERAPTVVRPATAIPVAKPVPHSPGQVPPFGNYPSAPVPRSLFADSSFDTERPSTTRTMLIAGGLAAASFLIVLGLAALAGVFSSTPIRPTPEAVANLPEASPPPAATTETQFPAPSTNVKSTVDPIAVPVESSPVVSPLTPLPAATPIAVVPVMPQPTVEPTPAPVTPPETTSTAQPTSMPAASTSVPESTPPAARLKPPATPRRLDFMELLDLDRDALGVAWERTEKGFVSPAIQFDAEGPPQTSGVQLPEIPAIPYRLKFTVEPLGPGPMSVGIPFEPNWTMVLLDTRGGAQRGGPGGPGPGGMGPGGMGPGGPRFGGPNGGPNGGGPRGPQGGGPQGMPGGPLQKLWTVITMPDRGTFDVDIEVRDRSGAIYVNNKRVAPPTEAQRADHPYRITQHATFNGPFIHTVGQYRISRLEAEPLSKGSSK